MNQQYATKCICLGYEGTRSIQSMYRIVFFTLIPTILELLFVAYYLGSQFGPRVSLAVLATFASFVTWTVLLAGVCAGSLPKTKKVKREYSLSGSFPHMNVFSILIWGMRSTCKAVRVVFSISLLQAATKVRREVNRYDNLTTAVAIDVLQNIETVMLFGNLEYEVTKYDKHLMGYQLAAVHNEKLMAFMNMGQTFILSTGLTAILLLTALLGSGGKSTAGKYY